MHKDVMQRGCVTIAKNGYVQELEEQLYKERELADKLAVELSACANTQIFNESKSMREVLSEWKQLRQ